MDENLFKIIQYTVFIIILVAARYLIPAIKIMMTNEKYATLIDYAEKCINAAEKLVTGTGEDKKAYVTELLKAWIKKTSISMTDEQLSILIEGIFAELDGITVNTYKQEQNSN